jgi:hypothetical protein
MGGSAQSAAARARTLGASLIVMPRGRSSRKRLADGLATTRSTVRAAAQSGTPADALAAADAAEWPPIAAAWCPAPPAAALPHAASPVTAPAAIIARIHRMDMSLGRAEAGPGSLRTRNLPVVAAPGMLGHRHRAAASVAVPRVPALPSRARG